MGEKKYVQVQRGCFKEKKGVRILVLFIILFVFISLLSGGCASRRELAEEKEEEETEAGQEGEVKEPVYVTVSAARVNLRTGPGTEYDIIFVVEEGDKLEELERLESGWLRVRTLEGTEAYIAGWLTDAGIPRPERRMEEVPPLTWDDFKMGEVWLWDKIGEVREKLGEPALERIVEPSPNGAIKEVSYYYKGLELTYAFDLEDGEMVFSRVTANSAGFPTPRGLQVGDSREEVFEKYGFSPNFVNGEVYREGVDLYTAGELTYCPEESDKIAITIRLIGDTVVEISMIDAYAM